MTAQDAALAFAAAFERATRDDGSEYVRLKDGSPDWMRDAVHAAHGDVLPDDWYYGACRDAADWLSDNDVDQWEDGAHEFADGAADVYNASLLRWLADVPGAPYFCDDAVSEGLIEGDADIVRRIQVGQYLALQQIHHAIRAACEEQAEESEQED